VSALTDSQVVESFVSCCNKEGMILQVPNYTLDENSSFHGTWAGTNREINDRSGGKKHSRKRVLLRAAAVWLNTLTTTLPKYTTQCFNKVRIREDYKCVKHSNGDVLNVWKRRVLSILRGILTSCVFNAVTSSSINRNHQRAFYMYMWKD